LVQISLHSQVAAVTGGSRGIGAATVKVMAAAGANVVFSYRNARTSGETLLAECHAAGWQVKAMRADVAKAAEGERLVEFAVRQFGRLDVLVANAGIWNADPAPIEKLTEKQWDEMMAVNLKGVYNVIRYAVPQMRKQNGGRIVVVSSTAGQRGEAFHTHYGASKGGLISFVKGLSTELAAHKILVNCVAPGWVDTDMCKAVTDFPKELQKVNSGIPIGRMARPEEIALPILFLASEMASYITGEVLNVNGGNVLCG
jgi:3-oxoacyl-[acyl-carrier protein] reductase